LVSVIVVMQSASPPLGYRSALPHDHTYPKPRGVNG
jgi:hypothetical protein